MLFRAIVSAVIAVIASGCATSPGPEHSSGQPTEQTAAASAPPEAAAAKAAKGDGSAIRCREEPVTNSRLRKNKVCMTEAAWAARANKAREAWDETRSPTTGVRQTNLPGGN